MTICTSKKEWSLFTGASNKSFKQLYISNKAERFSYKGGFAVCESHTCVEAFKRRATLDYR